MWFLEWEENSEKQEEKRKKLLSLSVFCWMVALAVLFLTEKVLYGEILKTNAGGFLGATLGTAIVFFLQKDSLRIQVQKERNRKAELILISVVTVAVATFSVFTEEVLFLVQWFCLIPAILWLAKLSEMEKYDKELVHTFALFVVSLIIVVTTVFVPRLLGYRNVFAAERMVAAEGYEDTEYLGWLYGRWMYQDAADKSFYEEEMAEEQYYMIFGRKDGEPYRFLIDPKGGEIIIAASEKEEPELGNWYRSREE